MNDCTNCDGKGYTICHFTRKPFSTPCERCKDARAKAEAIKAKSDHESCPDFVWNGHVYGYQACVNAAGEVFKNDPPYHNWRKVGDDAFDGGQFERQALKRAVTYLASK